MKKIFTLIGVALMAMSANAQDVYKAIVKSQDGEGKVVYELAPEFKAVVGEGNVVKAENLTGNNSTVKIEKTNITVEAVASATPKDCTAEGVSTWNEVKWESKNQGDIDFSYILGTGIAYTSWQIETMYEDDGQTVKGYRCLIGTDDNGWPNFYVEDGSHGLPISGLYYKFTPKVAGTLKVGVWMNKGNRRLFFVPADTKVAMDYTVEGYINGQNETYIKEDQTEGSRKKFLTNDEIRALGTDKWVMGAGNQPSWVYVTVQLEAGKEYWMFSQNAQVGFEGFEFTAAGGGESGIATIAAEQKNAPIFNLAGQRVSKNVKGLMIQNGKKFLVK